MVLSKLSERSEADTVTVEARQAVTYPTSVRHVTEANTLISQASNVNPQSWMRTLTT